MPDPAPAGLFALVAASATYFGSAHRWWPVSLTLILIAVLACFAALVRAIRLEGQVPQRELVGMAILLVGLIVVLAFSLPG